MSKIKWALDPAHSEIGFKVKHLMFTNVSGKITSYDIKVETDGDEFSKPSIVFTAEANSITTHNEGRDTHLHSADFFDVANFPDIRFTGTSFTKKSDDEYELTGDLTIHGVTKPVKLAVEGGLAKDPWGNIKAAFTVTGKINRKDWGLNWNAALETGGVLVSEEVRITADVQLIKQQ